MKIVQKDEFLFVNISGFTVNRLLWSFPKHLGVVEILAVFVRNWMVYLKNKRRYLIEEDWGRVIGTMFCRYWIFVVRDGESEFFSLHAVSWMLWFNWNKNRSSNQIRFWTRFSISSWKFWFSSIENIKYCHLVERQMGRRLLSVFD